MLTFDPRWSALYDNLLILHFPTFQIPAQPNPSAPATSSSHSTEVRRGCHQITVHSFNPQRLGVYSQLSMPLAHRFWVNMWESRYVLLAGHNTSSIINPPIALDVPEMEYAAPSIGRLLSTCSQWARKKNRSRYAHLHGTVQGPQEMKDLLAVTF